MLRAVRRIADTATPFTLKIGVHRGDVFSGEVGTAHRSTYTIMGDTVNLAARLMAAAPAGEIYVTRGVVDRSSTLFETSDVEPFFVKGKTAPVAAISMARETGTRDDRSATTKMVGRQQEVDTIRTSIDGLTPGHGVAYTISGPTGIGKTRLLEEAIADLDVPIIEIRA